LSRYNREIAKIDYITRLHNWDLYFERHKSNHQPFRSHIFNNSYKIIPISKHGENYCFTKIPNLNKSKFSTSYLGVDNFKCNPEYNTTLNEQKSQILKILTISFITPIKGLENLIHSLEKIKDIDIHWHHIGWGDITYENEIKIQAAQLITNNQNIKVTFHGKLSPIKIQDFLENKPIDLMINCSKNEGIPVTLMEAASAGIPILAYKIDGIPEIVMDNYNGFLVDYNLKKFSAEIQKFYHLKKEDKKRMSENAQTIQRNNFNAAVNYNNFVQLLFNAKQ
jgi:glycosyltransferase involved in cell wall biosynthesis